MAICFPGGDRLSQFERAPDAPPLPDSPFRFARYFVAQPQFRWWYAAMVALEAAHATCGMMIPYVVGQIVEGVTKVSAHSTALLTNLRTPLLLFIGLSIAEVLFGRAGGTCQILTGPRLRQTVTRSLYAYLQHHSHRYFSDSFAGALAHRISETSAGVSQALWALIFDFWPIAITLSVSTALLYVAHLQLGLLVTCWGALFVGASYWLAKRCKPYSFRAAAARSESTGAVVDSVTNLSSARLFARLLFERERLNETLDKEFKAIKTSNWYSERVRWFQFISAAILKIGMLYYALVLWSRGEIGVAEFVMAISLSLLVISEVRNLSRRFLEFFEFIGNVANGVQTIVKPHEIIDSLEAISPKVTQGKIEFRNVEFSYTPDKKTFDGLTVTIQPGQRVGLVGFSGSGKSTFVSLILRLYEPQRGQILIDGFDVCEMTQNSLHGQLGLIPQDPSLFHRTLMENIRYGRLEASDEDVIAAARKAHAHEFIAEMKEQYQSMVGERGVKLSGGQRQRIAIARVILKDAPILILDEATSSLDSITEKAIQETLDEAMKGKTVIVIAHRLSTIAHLDRILVFDKGRIIEDGAHHELLAHGGAYKRLWSKQAGGFLLDDEIGESVIEQVDGIDDVLSEEIADEKVEDKKDEKTFVVAVE
jgi:ATP-binding cassette, subfamily B, bacterial